MLGSSALMMTMPPPAPMYVKVISGSMATLSPTCFIETMARTPAREAPMPISIATFSLTDHSQLMASLNSATCSMISVEGVPG